ncbi:integrator complex subunit 10 isoform X2 [Bacillus rossius redtenbacheri]|uniref:integrator complex subunit 10 isoform X2 n=1 Tax=Bacillus rossius redtenbacheri TaxID=93214 RepID=UPI002FDD9636
MALQDEKNNATDSEYVISRAKHFLKTDTACAKVWIVTARTLFPDNFVVQFEAYNLEKSIQNPEEAAKCFSEVFEKFPNRPELWEEVDALTAALRSGSFEPNCNFLRDMFGFLLPEVQQKLLVVTADRSEDAMEHCRLLLLLLQRFPQTVATHGPKLLETLLTAEKHSHHKNSINCYRKLLVCDLLPLLGSSSVVLPAKQLFRLLNKAVEFLLCYVMSPNKVIQDLPELESRIEDPWAHLFLIVHSVGRKLGWETSAMFSQPWNKELYWQKIQKVKAKVLAAAEELRSFKEIMYSATVFFLRCLHEYRTSVDSGAGGDPPLVLVEAFVSKEAAADSCKAKRRRAEQDDGTAPLLTVGSPGAAGVATNFLVALGCWDLLHGPPALEKEFAKLSQHLRLDLCLGDFLLDAMLYKQVSEEALFMLQSPARTPAAELRRNLRLASVYCFKGDSRVVGALPAPSAAQGGPGPGGGAALLRVTSRDRHLHYLPLARAHVLQYCVKSLLICLERHVFARPGVGADLALGHAVTLSQYDWPAEEALAARLLRRIQENGSFCYKLFRAYVVRPDILEEFMFLSTEQGGALPLGILSSSQHSGQRRISTRGADKGVKEDFKLAMKQQVARCREPVDDLVVKFLVSERASVLQSLACSPPE